MRLGARRARERILEGRTPTRLEVRGDLELAFGWRTEAPPPWVPRLPRTLRVHGGLAIDDWRDLDTLPDELVVDDDLRCTGCSGLVQLPEDLTLGGSLWLDGCGALAELPPGLRVPGDLFLKDCPLPSLPDGLWIGGSLRAAHASLRTLPRGLHVGGDVDLWGCGELVELPPDLDVGGSLLLWGCRRLEALPPDLVLGGRLCVRSCDRLRELPRGLRIGTREAPPRAEGERGPWSRVHAEHARLGAGAPHDRHSARRWDALERSGVILDRARWAWWLDLTLCRDLRALPDDLTVAGSVSLAGCEALERLPRGLRVGGDLDLAGCTGLVELPADLQVGGVLNLPRPLQRPAGLACAAVALNDVVVPPTAVFEPERITLRDVLAEREIPVRRILLELFGLERFLRESGAPVIDRVEDEAALGGLAGAELYRQELAGDEPLVVVKVRNSTPETDGEFQVFHLRVPPGTRSCRQAIAWSFGLAEADYAPQVES